MERNVEKMLNRVSVAFISIGTVIMVIMILQTPKTCISPEAPSKSHTHFPRSTCDSSPRQHLPLPKKNARMWSSKAWKKRLSSFSSYFIRFRDLGFLQNHTKALCLSAGAGHAPMALSQIGLADVTAVELVESLPLVRRADPHNLPFFDGVFDFAFTAHLAEALFPWRFVEEMERTVRRGGICLVAVDECGGDDVKDITRLFLNSKLVDVANVTLEGSKMTSLLLKVQESPA
uniref:Methyltransferase type 11 domain-containing protein n=2 Tax=Noccaea caerulescens TaxID=107243 RepID=A0A1J3JET7_NOCCA